MDNVLKASILGTEYTVTTKVPRSEDKNLEGILGYCDTTACSIVIVDFDSIPEWEDSSEASKQEEQNTTIRHEVIHAYLYESGLWSSSLDVHSWAMNEEMVDWLAMQFPKILRTFVELGCV